jgi:hypothetical protein
MLNKNPALFHYDLEGNVNSTSLKPQVLGGRNQGNTEFFTLTGHIDFHGVIAVDVQPVRPLVDSDCNNSLKDCMYQVIVLTMVDNSTRTITIHIN